MEPSPRVLGFGCHPDDVEFMCAGVLALLKQVGWEIYIATMTGGDCGSMTLGPQEIHEIRFRESQHSADVLDGQYHWAGCDDVEVEYSHDLRMKVTTLLRKIRPDVVITHPPADYMVDHEETSKLVRATCFNAPMPNCCITPGVEAIENVPYLYYADAMDSIDILGRPVPIQFFVDISSVMETKAEMLGRHKSQRDWLREQHGVDQYIHHMKHQSAQRGKKIGVEYAEAFSQHLGHGYPQDNILSEVLGDYVKTAQAGK